MATATYDTEMIRNINLFESITDVEVRDAIIKEDEAYFVVPEGKAGMAIGKGGKVVQKVQEKLGRDIKIYEYNDNLGAFINNLVPADIRGVDIEDDKVTIDVPRDNKGRVVGKNGQKIESIREILQRTHGVEEVTVE
ncbi:NusA-like transcription termination signal-binding factor [Candidatus Nanosalina sp. VS9-1]|uniref:NusA-like transcription termination signal-binding factor n=1 Tax=Candidatus Nanosalina sp. VS9-1 TaxID=3388566 RepID=UPI0039E01CA5